MARNPACWKCLSPVATSIRLCSRITTQEMQSVSPHSLSARLSNSSSARVRSAVYHGYYGHVRFGIAAPDERRGELPQPGSSAQRIADLGEDGFGYHYFRRLLHLRKECQSARVVGVPGVEECLDIVGIQEEPSTGHRRDQAARTASGYRTDSGRARSPNPRAFPRSRQPVQGAPTLPPRPGPIPAWPGAPPWPQAPCAGECPRSGPGSRPQEAVRSPGSLSLWSS